ncbi:MULTISPECIES: TonB-dependent siderophore receptor [unclassified Brevundimonas]|uniref:TonB-dependent siderophore receptor n=1 Tax=unclassified Brevundimonas TaxID=2622653 RepID=UPI0025BB54BF|nr:MULTISPECIES: TonB-dependent siderophore receptor [unclassified Brevundimonas]
MDEIVVTGRAQRLYRTDKTTIGKTVENPLDIPQALQILNAELIEDQGARDITDLYRNISGVTFFSYAGVTFRGFRQDEAYFDGVRGNPFIGFAVPQLFNIERVEVLKGPAGMLYGPGSPGGMINYVSKTPSNVFAGEVKGVIGDYDRVGVSGEVTGPVDRAGRITARAGVFYEERDSFRVNAGSRNLIGDLGGGIALTNRTDLTLQASVYDQTLPGNRLRGVPVDMDGNFLTDITWNHNEPTDFATLEAQVYQARLASQVADNVRFDATARYSESSERQNYHEPRGVIDTDRDGRLDAVRRQFRDQYRDADSLSLAANLVADVRAVGLNHRILFGADWAREDLLFKSRTAAQANLGGPVPNLSLFNPVYGLTGAANYNLDALPLSRSDDRSIRGGVYLQDQVRFGERLIALAGVRWDRFQDDNRISGVDFEDSQATYRLGLIFKPRQDISTYLSWSDTFEPQAAGSQNADVGGPFAPVTGTQVEAGVKTALQGGRVQVNAAVYRIVRENILQADQSLPPINGRDQLRPIGEVTSDGFEVDVSTDLTANWVLTANYGYNDTSITGTAPGQSITNAVGDRFVNAPRHQAGFWTRYQVPKLRTAFAFGGEYVAERVGFNNERVKPYTVFDASITTTIDVAKVRLRVDNLFDKTYAASGFGLQGSFPGEPRTVFVEVSHAF